MSLHRMCICGFVNGRCRMCGCQDIEYDFVEHDTYGFFDHEHQFECTECGSNMDVVDSEIELAYKMEWKYR